MRESRDGDLVELVQVVSKGPDTFGILGTKFNNFFGRDCGQLLTFS